MRRGVLVLIAALVQLAVQLLVLPDLWEPPAGRVETWLVLEAVVAVLIGVVASDPRVVVAAVSGGWMLQAVWFAVTTPKDENHDMWAVGLVAFAVCGAVAVGPALAAQFVTRWGRLRHG